MLSDIWFVNWFLQLSKISSITSGAVRLLISWLHSAAQTCYTLWASQGNEEGYPLVDDLENEESRERVRDGTERRREEQQRRRQARQLAWERGKRLGRKSIELLKKWGFGVMVGAFGGVLTFFDHLAHESSRRQRTRLYDRQQNP